MLKVIAMTSILVYFILLIILVLNIEEKSKVIKFSFLVFIIILFAALFFVNELVMDYLLSLVIKFYYFPTFSMIILSMVITMVILISNVFKDSISSKKRIIDYIFASYIFIGFIIFSFLDVNINSYNALYSDNSLICLRYITRSFILWIIVKSCINYYSYFMKKG